jgi:hypothetical protein
VIWKYNTYHAGGAMLRPEEQEASRRSETGALAVDLQTGCASSVQMPEIHPTPASLLALNRKVGPFMAHGMRIVIEGKWFKQHEQTLLLMRRRGNDDLPPLKIGHGDTGYQWAVLSADLKHVLVGQRTETPEGLTLYAWNLVELASGKQRKWPPQGIIPMGFIVHRDHILATGGSVYCVPEQGKITWSQAMVITRYAGPFPP